MASPSEVPIMYTHRITRDANPSGTTRSTAKHRQDRGVHQDTSCTSSRIPTQPRCCCTVHAHTYALLHKPAPKRIHACEIDRGLQTASAFACVGLLCRAGDVHLHDCISEESQGPSGHRFMRGSVGNALQDGERTMGRRSMEHKRCGFAWLV